jgi:hypothetical protein
MAASNGDLTQQLIEGGLTPMAARAIANALANAASPQFSQGRDSTDATPREALRLITADTRRYSLTNLDYPVAAPFRDRLESTAGQFAGGPEDHPYKDSQPVTAAAPLANPRVQAGDYIAVDNLVDGGAEVSRVRLKLRLEPGRHLRLDPSTKSLEAVPLLTRTQGKYLSAEFVETEAGTELVISLRGLGFLDDSTELDLLLANGDSRKALVFPTDAAVGPASLAAGGTRSLTSTAVRLADGTSQNLLAWTDGAVTPAPVAPVAPAAICRAFAIFGGDRNTAGDLDSNNTERIVFRSENVSSVKREANGRYKVTLSPAMPNTEYVVLGAGNSGGANVLTMVVRLDQTFSTTEFQVSFVASGNTANNPGRAQVAVFW